MDVIRNQLRRLMSALAPVLVAAVVAAAAGFVPPTSAAPNRSAQTAVDAPCGEGVLGIAQRFNVFVQHDYSVVGTDVKGRAAAGGNVSIDSYAVGVDLPPDSSRADLIAGGGLTVGGGGAQAPNGSVTYGTTLQGSITTPHGQVAHAPPPFDVNVQFAQLASQAAAIGALTPNGTAGGPSYAYDLIGTSETSNVFRITATDLQTAQVIRIRVPSGSTTVVVVTGPSYSSARYPTAAIQFWNGSQYVQLPDSASPALEALRANLLWDFPEATSVQIGSGIAWQGTVLAPLAAVVFPGSTQLNGTLIAASLVNSAGSARNHPFTGCVPIGPPPPTLQAEDDHYAIQQPETLRVATPGVLQNDTKPPGATVTAELVAAPQHGMVSLAGDGAFTYTPAKGFAGKDTFTYRVRQGSASSNIATVTIDVSAAKARLVTFVARVCPEYTDVMANLARNDIQESLRDLGPDSRYSPGQPIDPDLEAKADPNCRPLPAWQLTLGRGIESRAVSGPWGSLSIVTSPFATPIVTQDETSLLNDQGQPTGRQVAGAVTLTLTETQAALASTHSALWVQGGTPTDPILDRPYPGQYGFAALRCAVDNLNGDNVEWIAYPTGASHVFCYAYYIQPPPTSGTIIVRKAVSTPAGATETFPFTGNITFNADDRFELRVVGGAPASETFLRAETETGDAPWSFKELVPPGWSLTSIVCISESGDSRTTTDVPSAETSVILAAGDVVTCTYTNTETPPEGSLRITKTTTGGVGTFRYTVTPAGSQGGSAVGAVATTSAPGVEVAASPATIPLAPGSYTIAESLPSVKGGTWSLTGVHCNGAEFPAKSPVTVTIVSGSGLACRFENRFVPSGSISVSKLTWGGTGTAGFAIYPLREPVTAVYLKKAVVTKEGVVVRARGSATNELALGRYRIREFAAPGTDPAGWALTSVVCDGVLVGAGQGAVVLTLTEANPTVDCVFTNTFTPGPKPPEPPTPTPPPNPDPLPVADLHVTKTADRTTVRVGDTVTYTIKVSNTGKAAAQGVVLAEKTPLTTATIVAVEPSQGVCPKGHAPAACYLGTIEPGQTVTVVAKLKATKVGPMPNSVAVSAATDVLEPPTGGVVGDVVAEDQPSRPKPPRELPFTG